MRGRRLALSHRADGRRVTRSDMLEIDIEDDGREEGQRWLPILKGFGLLCLVGELVRETGMEERRE